MIYSHEDVERATTVIRTAFALKTALVFNTYSGDLRIDYIGGRYKITKIESEEIIRENLKGFQAIDFLLSLQKDLKPLH